MLTEAQSLTEFVAELFYSLYEVKIMAHHALSSQESYNPNHLLDILLGKMQLKNDAALSRMLEVAPPVISKIRHHRLPVGASLLIRMHEVTGMSIRDLRDLMGDRRTKYRLSDAQGRPKPEEKAAQAAAAQQQQQQQQAQNNEATPSSSGNYAH
jgi:Sec-independent protein translocase protein TatA